MRRVLAALSVVSALLAACVPQLATAAPTGVHAGVHAVSAETVRVSVVAHIPLPDSLVSDSAYVNTLMHRAVGAVMLGLNESSVRWTDVVVGLQYAKPANTMTPSGRSSSNSHYWRLDRLARDSGTYARTRLRLTRT